VDEAVVVVDFNHPLAGHRLLLDIHVLAVNAAV
jgi:FKBP-type peptidyl-prolyl cis-trans isomerase 2